MMLIRFAIVLFGLALLGMAFSLSTASSADLLVPPSATATVA